MSDLTELTSYTLLFSGEANVGDTIVLNDEITNYMFFVATRSSSGVQLFAPITPVSTTYLTFFNIYYTNDNTSQQIGATFEFNNDKKTAKMISGGVMLHNIGSAHGSSGDITIERIYGALKKL